MNKKGGYIIIDLQSATIVNDLAKALDSNKPVLVYDAYDVANFYTLSYDSDNEVFTLTGAKDIISVDGDGAVTTDSKHLYANNIEIHADDSLSNSIYIFLTIIANKILTSDDIKNYIKDNTDETYPLVVNGYNSDTQSIYSAIRYSSNEEYEVYDTTDTIIEIIITQVKNKSVQII